MGTRSLTVFKDGNVEIAVMYRQNDGYPEGHGKDLQNFLEGMIIGNGIRPNGPKKFANGMDCLAAQIIAHFKTQPGGIYLMPAGTRDVGEDYIYIISSEDEKPTLECYDPYHNEQISLPGGQKVTSEK